MLNSFEKEAATQKNPKWGNMIKRNQPLYRRENETRTEFERDYTRVIHSNAYRRLKHKTQVFFSPQNDHICTRIEHVGYVESISNTIAKSLGLNVELTRTIAVAHDIGHAPFGHKGERVLSEISQKEIGLPFWHEKNGVNFVDHIELLEDEEQNKQNLNLTYAVRDGIISHCGEIDEEFLRPREKAIPLEEYSRPNEYAPYTWEGCVVKIADKISYLFRDIEDAIRLHMLEEEQQMELNSIFQQFGKERMNNTVMIHELTNDLCSYSSLNQGLTFSKRNKDLIYAIKQFNYKQIYLNPRVEVADRYFRLILEEIYYTLQKTYQGKETPKELEKLEHSYPNLTKGFLEWIRSYWDLEKNRDPRLKNEILYPIKQSKKAYQKAIIDYLAGMTDNYAIQVYEEMIHF